MTGSARYVRRSKPYKGRTCHLACQLADEDPQGLNIQVEEPSLLVCVIVLLNPKELLQHHLASLVELCMFACLIVIEENLYQIHVKQSMHKASLLTTPATCPVRSLTKMKDLSITSIRSTYNSSTWYKPVYTHLLFFLAVLNQCTFQNIVLV